MSAEGKNAEDENAEGKNAEAKDAQSSPHPPHIPPSVHTCLDEDTLVLRAKDDAALAALALQVAHCPACSQLLTDIARVRTLEHSLRSLAGASRAPKPPRTSTDALLSRVGFAATTAPQQPPAIPGYHIEHELRRGGQGVIYRAVQQTTNRPAAIKLLLAGSLASLRERYRFEREIEIASSLRHPHIVAIFEAVSTTEGRMGYAMDFVEGQPIDLWSDALRPRLTPQGFRKASLELFAKVCRAVQHAHSRGVIHRDLKPGNVLVDSASEPRLLDFGLARERPSLARTLGKTPPENAAAPALATSAHSLTLSGEFVGTPQYAAPEQLELDTSEVDGRADVYALGMMLYRLACGKLPYIVEGSLRSVVDTVCKQPIPRPSLVAKQGGLASIDSDLETIILKALAKDRERRYQTALELAQDLELLLRGAAINARRESTLYVVRKWISTHKLEASLALAASVAVLGSVVGGIILSERASKAREREASQRAQREEQATRAQAVATVVAEILPPPDQSTDAPPARWLEENLLDLREAIDAGWLSDRPDLAAQVQSVLSDIYALRGTRSGWYAEAAARNAKSLLREAYGDNDPRVLRMREAEVAALIARKRNTEGIAQATQLLEAWRAQGPDWLDHVASTKVLLAQALLQDGRVAQARSVVENLLSPPEDFATTAQRSSSPSEPSLVLAKAHYVHSNACTLAGDAAPAYASALRALRMRLALRRDPDTEVIQSLLQLADTLASAPLPASDSWQPTPDTLRTLASALRAAEGERTLAPLFASADDLVRCKVWLFGEGSQEHAESLALIGNSYRRESMWTLAASWTQRAAQAMERAHPTPSLAAMNLYSAAAEGHRMTLDPASEWSLSAHAADIARQLPEGDIEPLFRGAVYRDAGSAAARAGVHDSARPLLQEALRIFEASTGPTSHVVANGHARLAEAALLAGDAATALHHALRAESIGRASPSMPVDQRVDMLGTLARALLVSGSAARAREVSQEALVAATSADPSLSWIEQHGQQWGRAEYLWVASCALQGSPEADALARDELARDAQAQWDEGMRFMRQRYGRQALFAPPWERYPFPQLRQQN
jgi:serine/threonine protein kinase